MQVTAEQVKAAMMAANLDWAVSHDCSICGTDVGYVRVGDRLYFRPACHCSFSPEEPRTWQDAADWINMQSGDEHKAKIAARFGLALQADA